MHEFIRAWKEWDQSKAPYYLPGDEEGICYLEERGKTVTHESWDSMLQDPWENFRADTRLHLGLIPQPFFGDPSTAKIVVLALNPGLNPHDYHAEFHHAFDTPLRDVLKGGSHNLFLDPHYSWHSGFTYWFSRVRETMVMVAEKQGRSFEDVWNWFRNNFAVMQVIPYHSSKFNLSMPQLRKFRSTQLARSFVQDVLIPKTQEGSCLLIATRQSRWKCDFPNEPNIVVYSPQSARSSYLSPNTDGGEAILRWLQ